MTMRISKRALAGLAGFGLMMAASAANAEVDPSYGGQGTDKFTLTGGWVFTNIDGSISLDGATSTGTPIDLNGNGNGKGTSSFMAAANWRFATKHRATLLWFQSKRDQSYTTANDIVIDDNVIPAGASIAAEIKSNYFFGTYRYSFIKKDNLELAGVLGLYGNNFKFTVDANKYPGSPTASYSNDTSVTLPLPVIGGSFDWYISPRWSAGTSLQGLKAKIGDVDGSIWVLTASTDYMLFHNFGIGVSYLHTAINVDVTKKAFNGNLFVKNNSFLLYGVIKF